MNKSFIIKYSYDYFCMKLKNHLSVIVMLCVSLVFCCVTVFLYGRMEYTEGTSEFLLKNGNDGTGLIIINNSMSGEEKPDYRELEMLEGVDRVGYYEWQVIDGEQNSYYLNLYRTQLEANNDAEGETSGLRILYSTPSLVDLCNLQLKKGAFPTKYEPNTLYAFVGSNYKNISIGDSFTYSRYYGKFKGKIVICGVLEEGSEWLTDSFYGESIAASTVGLDDEIIVFGFEQMPNSNYDTLVFACDKAEMLEVCSRIVSFYEQRGVSAYAISFTSWFASSKAEQSLIMKYLSQLLAFVTIVTVFLMVCTQAVLTLDSRRDFGIWYANGAGRKDIFSVVSINVIAECIMAALMAFTISWFIIVRLSVGNAAIASSIQVFLHYVLPVGILILVVIAILGIAIPFNILSRETPSKLIKEYTV